ncbi:MAG: hypothetical protein ABL986_06695 [Vicinamibacterales bacterium]
MHGARREWPRVAGLLLALAMALSIAHSVYRIPVQVGDSLDVILVSRHAESSVELLKDASTWSPTTLRPMRYLQARWLSVLAESLGTSYHAVFRGTHAALATIIVGLIAWIANPRRWADVVALGIALTVLIGLHTFDAMMREAFPVNHYAEVAAAALFVLGSSLRPHRLISEIVVLLALVWGLLLIESAGLIWIVIVTCAALRMPGMRTRTAVMATVVLALFFIARWQLEISTPGIGSHSSGWGGGVLSGDELAARFSTNPWPFYAYNVSGGALSLLASEPRFGMYQLLAAQAAGSLNPVVTINLVSSLGMTVVLIICCWSAMRRPFHQWSLETKTLATGIVVITVSAVLCAAYIKDDIISTAGVLYAVMAYLAVQWALGRLETGMRDTSVVALALCLALVAPLWGFRAVGTHYELRRVAFTTRNDWALKSVNVLAGGDSASRDDVARTGRLRGEALRQRVTSPTFLPDWGERYWVE